MGKKHGRAKKLFADRHFKEAKHYSKRYAATALSIISVVICVLTVVGIIVFKDYFSAEKLDKLQAFVGEHWLAGTLIFIGVCIIQVVFALIPGEAVEIAAGVIFGPWWGTVICLVGITLGSCLVILLVRRFGRGFVESLYPREKIDSLPILNDPKKRNVIIFLLFLIPGTPKDLITYIIGLTEVSIPMYIMLTTLARIPSIITSTFGGAAVGDGKILKAVIIFSITAVISGVGYLIYLFIQKKTSDKGVRSDNSKNKDK